MFEARGVASRSLPAIELTCGVGVHALVVGDPAAAAELVAIAAGLSPPRRGKLRVNGKDPFRTPELRRLTGTLLVSERPVDGRSVEESLGRALALHRSPLKAADVLQPFGLSILAARSPGTLSGAEHRAVALALALSLDPVSLLVLHEPLATSLDRARVTSALAVRARTTTVLVVTASVRDARALGGRVLVLSHSGVVPWQPPGGMPGARIELTATAPEPERLFAALSSEPWAGEFTCERRGDGVLLSGVDIEVLSRALLGASGVSGVAITRLSCRAQNLPARPGPSPPGVAGSSS